jgi:hypothetical protein
MEPIQQKTLKGFFEAIEEEIGGRTLGDLLGFSLGITTSILGAVLLMYRLEGVIHGLGDFDEI